MSESSGFLFRRRHISAVVLGGFLASSGLAKAESEPRELLTRARVTLEDARADPQFGNAPDLFRRARAVMVVPQLVKGGFFLGGEGGNAVLLTREASGGWGNPVFYTLGSVSFGFQIGIEVAEVVFFIMTDKALRAWTQDEFKLGVEAGLAVFVVGSNASISTTTAANFDVIAWAKAKGAYAGITVEGSLIKPRAEWNAMFYGRPVRPADLIKPASN